MPRSRHARWQLGISCRKNLSRLEVFETAQAPCVGLPDYHHPDEDAEALAIDRTRSGSEISNGRQLHLLGARIQRPRRGAPEQTYELSPVRLIELPLAKEPPQHSGSRGSSQGLLHREISIRPMSGWGQRPSFSTPPAISKSLSVIPYIPAIHPRTGRHSHNVPVSSVSRRSSVRAQTAKREPIPEIGRAAGSVALASAHFARPASRRKLRNCSSASGHCGLAGSSCCAFSRSVSARGA